MREQKRAADAFIYRSWASMMVRSSSSSGRTQGTGSRTRHSSADRSRRRTLTAAERRRFRPCRGGQFVRPVAGRRADRPRPVPRCDTFEERRQCPPARCDTVKSPPPDNAISRCSRFCICCRHGSPCPYRCYGARGRLMRPCRTMLDGADEDSNDRRNSTLR